MYLAEGYSLPKETIGKERIVYVKKGMVAQRALQYNEIETEWILFLDDDVELEPDCMERIFDIQEQYSADVIAFDAFPKSEIPLLSKLIMFLCLTAIPHYIKDKGYRINCWGTYNYNARRNKDVAWSSTNSGNGFICRKLDFLNIKFEEELWLDKNRYAWPNDAVMFYKMHKTGLRILTWYKSPFRHLDAQSTGKDATSSENTIKFSYLSAYNSTIFYFKHIYPELPLFKKIAGRIFRVISTLNCTLYLLLRYRHGMKLVQARRQGFKDGKLFYKNEI